MEVSDMDMPKIMQWTSCALLVILAYILQINMFMHTDVIYLANAAKMMLAGGTYAHDFFESNPPMIMFLYMPPVLLAKLTSISLIYTMRLYVIALMVASVSACYFFFKKIFINNLILQISFLYLLIFVLFFLCAFEFAQREHLLIILIFPYLFMCAYRLENRPVSPWVALLIGVFAGLGFALKPFFLIPLIFIEAYFIYIKRNLFSFIRIESVAIASVLILYLISTFYFFPDYMRVILPIVSRVYFVGVASPWNLFFTNINVLYCFSAVGLYLFARRTNHYLILGDILFLALIGLISAFTIPRTLWYYHLLPAYAVAVLLFALVLIQFIFQNDSRRFFSNTIVMDKVFLLVLALAIFAIPFSMTIHGYHNSIQIKRSLFSEKYLAFFNETTGQKTFDCFSLHTECQIASLYSHGQYVGRYSLLWWANGLLVLQKSASGQLAEQLSKDEALLVDGMADDLAKKKPRYVLLDDTGMGYKETIKMKNLFSQFAKYKHFREESQRYHYIGMLARFRLFERKI